MAPVSTINPLFPRQPVPALEVATVGGGTWRLADQKPRGLHCPICANYLGDLNRKVGDFAERRVEIVVISSDNMDRATKAKEQWGMDKLTVGYGLELDKAREWGLYISSSRGKTSVGIEEPALFSEPALYLVRPDGTLYFGAVQTMPFARPRFTDILQALDFVMKNDYPARGEVIDHRADRRTT
jgi:peroxiredoxin